MPISGNSNYPTAYRIGCGRIRELPEAVFSLGLKQPLVVSDPGVAALPSFLSAMEALRRAGLEPGLFTDVRGNPGEAEVMAGVQAYRSGGHDGCIAFGGGSSIDVGKCIALMVGQTGSLFDYEDVGDNWKRVNAAGIAATIAVPTTAGTGSEVGRASVIVDPRDHGKKIIFHARMQPVLVIADPELTFGLPPKLTAATGMDALAHSFEALCAPGYHPMADGIALEALRLISHNLPRAFSDGLDAEARTHMLMASAMGATAFQKGLGLVHALSHPLGGAIGIHHGLANAIFLPYVLQYNRDAVGEVMARLARHLELPGRGTDAVLQWLLSLRRDLGIPHTLAEIPDFTPELARSLAPAALADPSLGTNPVPANVEQIEELFLKSYRGEL